MRKTITECRALCECCSYVKHWINRQPAVKEESITDWLLFDISESIKRIKYHSFTRHEEARQTGADWEWWFLFPSFAYRIRVQAKKINPKDDNYPSIAKTNDYGLQIEKLLNDANNNNSWPIYAFYTNLDPKDGCELSSCKKSSGVFISGAKTIYETFITNGKIPVHAADILGISNPLSCLLCCLDSLNGDGAIFSSGTITGCFDSYRDTTDSQGYYKQTPRFIQIFMEQEETPEWWEGEFQHEFESVNRLLVYDSRSRP